MGGRIHGFLGGVLLTSALTYYTGEYFNKNQQFISHHLKSSNDIINNKVLSDRGNDILTPIDKSVNYTRRQGIVETSKDIWNDEIIKMVNWIYSINWYQNLLKADEKYNNLTEKVANSVTK